MKYPHILLSGVLLVSTLSFAQVRSASHNSEHYYRYESGICAETGTKWKRTITYKHDTPVSVEGIDCAGEWYCGQFMNGDTVVPVITERRAQAPSAVNVFEEMGVLQANPELPSKPVVR